jgi:hypothetical protein
MDFRQTGLMKINFLHAPRILLCVFIFLFAIIVSGCFMADNKFYLDSDIITDSLFVGKFRFADSITNIQGSMPSLTIETETNKHYIGTYHEGENWIKLDTVFFRLGTNTFVDFHRLDDSGESHDVGFNNDREVGLNCPHFAFHIFVEDNQIKFKAASTNELLCMFNETSETKASRVLNHGSLVKLTGSTEELRDFLIKHASDEAIAPDTSWLRVKSEK